MKIPAFVSLLSLVPLACQTTDRAPLVSGVDEASTAEIPDEEPGKTGAARPEEAGAKADEAPSDGKPLALGPVADEDFRKSIYKALDSRISKKQALDEEGEQTTEIGDLESFKFTVTRLNKGKEEITGQEAPDNAEVEVTGWYKVSVSSKSQADASPECTSFDATVWVSKVGEEWQATAGQDPVIGREDAEDCF